MLRIVFGVDLGQNPKNMVYNPDLTPVLPLSHRERYSQHH